MYLEHFRFKHKPFSLTPDPAFLYLSATHKEALGHMLYGLNNRTGFIAIVGEVGTGKTTLLRTLLAQLSEEVFRTAFIFNPRVSSLELLRGIMREFGLETQGQSRDAMLDALNRYLLEQNTAGRTVVLVIDEAQNLGTTALEEVRLLSNLETETDKLLQVVLVGQPELARTLEDRKLRQLRERISVYYHLKPLSAEECFSYACHRIEVAGGVPDQLFSRATLNRACRASQGIPRRLNVLLDRALLIAFTQESRKILAAHMKQAIQELRTPLRRPFGRPLPWVVGLFLLALVGFGSGQFAARQSVLSETPGASVQPDSRVHPLVAALSATTSQRSRNAALTRLLEQWGEVPVNIDTSAPVEQIVNSRGLTTYRHRGSLEELLELNSPAIIQVRLPGVEGTRYMTLLSAEGDRYSVSSIEATPSILSLSQLRSFWNQEALVVWGNPAGIPALVRLGDSGQAVMEIQKRLLGAGVYSGVLSGRFDDELLAAVRSFQAASGLPVDGHVGPRTMIRLYQSGGMDSPATLNGRGA